CRSWRSWSWLLLLRFFTDYLLVGVAHAFALVGFGRTERANLRGYLADQLLVGALHHEIRLIRRFDRDAVGNRVDDRVRIAEREIQLLALHGGAETDADDGELLLEPLGDAGNHIVRQRARRSRNRARHGRVARARKAQLPVRLRHVDERMDLIAELSLRSLDAEVAARELHLHAFRHDDRIFCNSRHTPILRNARAKRASAPVIPNPRVTRDPAHGELVRRSDHINHDTTQITSPPRPAARAARSVMMPFDVETMAMPSPCSTRGNSSLPA